MGILTHVGFDCGEKCNQETREVARHPSPALKTGFLSDRLKSTSCVERAVRLGNFALNF